MSAAGPNATPLADRFLDYLRAKLPAPALCYAEPPAAMRGGHDTQIFAFRLDDATGAPAGWASPLVLRVLPRQHDPRRALREAAAQNAVVDLGYPAPRVLDASADVGTLGGAFLIMERATGRPMLDERRFGIATTLVDIQARLHALDAEPFLRAMDGAGGREQALFDALLGQLARRAAGHSHDGLRPGMDWLLAHRPPAPPRLAICHGDLHPLNVLMAGRTVTAVLDWPNAVVADPAYDVAATKVILAFVPMSLMPVSAPVRVVIQLARLVMVNRYMAGMRRHRPMPPPVLAYFEAVACMRQLVRVCGARLAAAEHGAPLDPLDASSFGDRLGEHFARITGVRPLLPPPAGTQ
jgi:aminoglycoside phosphotransferase (APT) family kinase protein